MTHANEIAYRRVTERSQLDGFRQCAEIGFQHPFPNAVAWFDGVATQLDSLDHRVAIVDGQTVGTFLSFDQELTAVGGASVRARAVSAVTVLPTHRRRGILTAHMHACLSEAQASGAAASTLIAAEAAIYGRYGYGKATEAVDYRITVDRGALPAAPVDEVRYVDGVQYLEAMKELEGALSIAGAVAPMDLSMRQSAGLLGDGAPDERRRVVLRRGSDTVGVLRYTVEPTWEDSLPRSTLTINELVAVDTRAERDLWAFAMRIDWVRFVKASGRPLDDIVTEIPTDTRTVQVSGRTDFLWIRPLDVPALFAARTYAAPGQLVVDIVDRGFDGRSEGPAQGRFLIDTEGGSGSCAPTRLPPDLSLDVTALGRLWLSDQTVGRAVATGAVVESSPGAAARADLMFFHARRPWAIHGF